MTENSELTNLQTLTTKVLQELKESKFEERTTLKTHFEKIFKSFVQLKSSLIKRDPLSVEIYCKLLSEIAEYV